MVAGCACAPGSPRPPASAPAGAGAPRRARSHHLGTTRGARGVGGMAPAPTASSRVARAAGARALRVRARPRSPRAAAGGACADDRLRRRRLALDARRHAPRGCPSGRPATGRVDAGKSRRRRQRDRHARRRVSGRPERPRARVAAPPSEWRRGRPRIRRRARRGSARRARRADGRAARTRDGEAGDHGGAGSGEHARRRFADGRPGHLRAGLAVRDRARGYVRDPCDRAERRLAPARRPLRRTRERQARVDASRAGAGAWHGDGCADRPARSRGAAATDRS